MANKTHVGRCLCGKLSYSITGPARELSYCHCSSCRRAAGAPLVAWGTVDREHFQISSGELAIFDSSPGVKRGFCRECGTSLTYENLARTGEIDFTLASLVEPNELAPEYHIWTRDKLAWVHLDDALPQHELTRA